MSEQTHAALETAIQTHLNDEWDDGQPPILTDWVLAAAAVAMTDQPGDTRYKWWSNGGPQHSIVGLTAKLAGWIEEDDE